MNGLNQENEKKCVNLNNVNILILNSYNILNASSIDSQKTTSQTRLLPRSQQVCRQKVEDQTKWRKRNRRYCHRSRCLHECCTGESIRIDRKLKKNSLQGCHQRKQHSYVGTPRKSYRLILNTLHHHSSSINSHYHLSIITQGYIRVWANPSPISVSKPQPSIF